MLGWSNGRILGLDARGSEFDPPESQKIQFPLTRQKPSPEAPISHRSPEQGWFRPEITLSLNFRLIVVENVLRSRGWFRSTDLWVMGPARFLCATLLKATRSNWKRYSNSIQVQITFSRTRLLVLVRISRLRSSVVRALVL